MKLWGFGGASQKRNREVPPESITPRMGSQAPCSDKRRQLWDRAESNFMFAILFKEGIESRRFRRNQIKQRGRPRHDKFGLPVRFIDGRHRARRLLLPKGWSCSPRAG